MPDTGSSQGRVAGALARLGGPIARAPWAVVLVWAVLLALALPAAKALPGRLSKAGAGVPGSRSAEVRRLLVTAFANPFVEPVILAIHSPRYTWHDRPFADTLARLDHDLRACPDVRRLASPRDAGADPRLVSPDGHSALVLVGPAGGPEHTGEAVNAIRAAARPAIAALGAADPGLESGATGPGAFTVDIIGRNAVDSARAEGRVMLPALILLLWVFGSPVAALLPLVTGVIATILTLGAASWLATAMPLNGYVQTAGTMLGLALGIDYALLVVGRYREERRPDRPLAETLGAVLGHAGWTVACSGLVVLAAMLALLPSRLVELQSVGVGAALTVFFAAALATTLLPALLALADRWLDAPRGVVARVASSRTGAGWTRWGAAVARRRWLAAALALALLVWLAWPAGRFQGGLPDGRWYPADLEAARGAEVLAGMHRAGLGFPFQLVVRRTDGGPILATPGVAALVGLSRSLRKRPEVADVVGPVDLPGAPHGLVANLLFYHDPAAALARHPAIGELFVSQDRTRALVQLVLRDETTLSRAKQLVRDLRSSPTPGLEVAVGGLAAAELDLEEHQRAYAPFELGLVFIGTFALLFAAFRSVAVPLKAIALNLLAVGAAMGLIVRVFQDGTGAAWVGLASPLSSVPITLPLLIFCLTFGLSMDYEIFMLARVREARGGPGGETEAIARGLGATGGIITAAAAIMVVVFGAFVAAQMVLVKILGFGLAVAIGLDATVVRGVLAPATLAIAGRWNWWPGDGRDHTLAGRSAASASSSAPSAE